MGQRGPSVRIWVNIGRRMNSTVHYGRITVERDGNRISLSEEWRWEPSHRHEIVVLLTDDGGIEIDEGWSKPRDEQRERETAWRSFLHDDLSLPWGIIKNLDAPPRFVSREKWIDYLGDIVVSGEFKIKGVGKVTTKYIEEAIQDIRRKRDE